MAVFKERGGVYFKGALLIWKSKIDGCASFSLRLATY
jgi:hypothetical protein